MDTRLPYEAVCPLGHYLVIGNKWMSLMDAFIPEVDSVILTRWIEIRMVI
jgi:hypothetical protein